jgi:hypothetical protein
VQQHEAAENELANLRIERAKVDGERRAVEADTGPVRYLATLIGSTDEQTTRSGRRAAAARGDEEVACLWITAPEHAGAGGLICPHLFSVRDLRCRSTIVT